MSDAGFEILGEVRKPPVRSRAGRYKEVYAAVEAVKAKNGAWVALAAGDEKAMLGVRNAISRQVAEDLGYHTQLHEEEDGSKTLYVKYDSKNPRQARANRKVAEAEAAQEDDDDAALAAVGAGAEDED